MPLHGVGRLDTSLRSRATQRTPKESPDMDSVIIVVVIIGFIMLFTRRR
ncbi:MAG TPA: hypothetical protein VH439_17135 [Gemmatimonadales bacterium]